MNPSGRVPFLDLRASQGPLDASLDALWHRVTRSGEYIGGQEVETFEALWADFCGTSDAVGVANGTDAIELTLRGLGIGPGDEVIVPTNTFIATAEAVTATGAVPVFVDVDDDTLLITADAVGAALTERTAAVIVVHLYGQAADLAALSSVALRAGIALVEDCAQAHGAAWDGRPVGSVGVAGCFSFYPGKNLGAFGDGGSVVTSDGDLARRIRQLGNHGRSSSSRYLHDEIGRNSRLDALQAGVLAAKLPHLLEWNASRRAAHGWYQAGLDGVDAIRSVVDRPESLSSHHLEVVRVPGRDHVLQQLQASGIGAAVHYPVPCHLNPGYRHFPVSAAPVSEAAAQQVLSLPMFPGITQEQVAAVCGALVEALGGAGRW